MIRPVGSPTNKSKWTRKDTLICNTRIVELDMKRAGLSVVKQEKLLPPALIHELESIPKLESSIQIGKLSRTAEYKGLAKLITDHIKTRIRDICDVNNIADINIISVKRDAVFIRDVVPSILTLPNGTEFKIKNSYSDYMFLNGIEVYFGFKTKRFDIKGINDEVKDLHKDFIIAFLFCILELVRKNRIQDAIDTICQFRIDYLNKTLDTGFYRDFNSASGYTISSSYRQFSIRSVTRDIFMSRVLINYNFENVIVPLMHALITPKK